MANILTQKTVKILGIVGLVAVLGAGVGLVAQPAFKQVTEAQENKGIAEEELALIETQFANLQGVQQNYDATLENAELLATMFPSTVESKEFVNQLVLASVDAGLSPLNMSTITINAPALPDPTASAAPTPEPAEEEPAEGEEGGEGVIRNPEGAATPDEITGPATGNMAEVEINLSVSGNPENLTSFLNNLNTMDRALKIKTFSIRTTEEGPPEMSLTGTIYSYKYIPNAEEVLSGEYVEPEPAPVPST